MRVVLTGATGTIGTALARRLRERGDEVVALSRDAARGRERLGEGVEVHAWPDPAHGPPPTAALAGADAVANLLGEPIAQRWSTQAKRRIRESRVHGTRELVRALAALPDSDRPRTLVSQSATGYYGPRDAQPVPEDAPAGRDLLAGIVVAWEQEARAAEQFARVVRTRTGVVLSPDGGALARMLPPFKLGVGGPVAGGRQYVPWVHLDDVVGALLRSLDDDSLGGAVNVTAPNPVPNSELARALGRVLHRPAVAPVPALALKLLYGEMSTIVTTGARVVPARLEQAGHRFAFPDLEPALRDVLRRG
jgi:uncharacterized protein (TIGR01777 family)